MALLADGELVRRVVPVSHQTQGEEGRSSQVEGDEGKQEVHKKTFRLCCECSLLPQRQPRGFRKANVSLRTSS